MLAVRALGTGVAEPRDIGEPDGIAAIPRFDRPGAADADLLALMDDVFEIGVRFALRRQDETEGHNSHSHR